MFLKKFISTTVPNTANVTIIIGKKDINFSIIVPLLYKKIEYYYSIPYILLIHNYSF